MWNVLLDPARIGAHAEQASQALLQAAAQKRPKEYGILIQQLGPHSKVAAPILAEGLGDKDMSVRAAAIQALGLLGPAAKSAVPQLTNALNDEEPSAGIVSQS